MSAEKALGEFEVIVGSAGTSRAIGRKVRAGTLRKIGPRLYTSNLRDTPAEIVRRNVWIILGHLLPGSVVSHRSALEGRPGDGGAVFLTGRYARTLRLPGIVAHVVPGPEPLPGDQPFVGDLVLASPARALLEALKAGGRRGSARGITAAELEERLERWLQSGGEPALNKLRDHARNLAPALGAERAFRRLDAVTGTLLGTRSEPLRAAAAVARQAGLPYDIGRLSLLEDLLVMLRNRPTPPRPDASMAPSPWRHVAFVDAYFSNYIEGTEFEVTEARAIVFNGRIPLSRPQDAHDILGTYRILADRNALRGGAAPASAVALVRQLRAWHAAMLAERPEIHPGEFKTEPNRAGETRFVAPDLVEGTLHHGYELLRALGEPFARAAFVMFLVTEVHPFTDGNGRLARVAMNAELAAGGETRIIIPTVYRDDYLSALRALSRQRRAEPFLRMLDRAQRLVSEVPFTDLDDALAELTACEAFKEPAEGRLRLPSERPRPTAR